MTDPFWKPMADSRDRYRAALKEIVATTTDPKAKEIARMALRSPLAERARRAMKRR